MGAARWSRSIRALSIFLGLFYTVAGAAKLVSPELMVGYSIGVSYTIGLFEIAGGGMILAPRLRLYGASLLLALMTGIVVTQIYAGEWTMLPGPLVMIVLTGIVVWAARTHRRASQVQITL